MRNACLGLAALLLASPLFALDAPTLVSPTGNEKTSQNPTFHWSPVSGAQSYLLQLNETSGKAIWTKWVPGALASAIPLPESLKLTPGVSYRWWLRAYSATAGYSPWSAAGNFVAGRERYVSIAPAAFHSLATSEVQGASYGHLIDATGAAGAWFLTAGVDLPHGAVVTRLQMRWIGMDPNGEASLKLNEMPLTGPDPVPQPVTMAESYSLGVLNGTISDTSIDQAQVDNKNRVYYLVLGLTLGGNGEDSGLTRRFYGAVVYFIE